MIVDAGRLLASGTIEDLRRHVARHVRINVEAPAGWSARLPGLTVLAEDAAGAIVQLPPGADAQALLRVAQTLGPVEHFGFESGGLIDLYRELVPRPDGANQTL